MFDFFNKTRYRRCLTLGQTCDSSVYYPISNSVLHYEFPDPIDSDAVLGTITDRSGNSNDGSVLGRWSLGFEASSETGVSVGTPIVIPDDTYVGVWVRPDVASPDPAEQILDNLNSDTSVIIRTDGKLNIKGSSHSRATTLPFFTSNGVWVHLGIMFTDLRAEVYRNGVKVDTLDVGAPDGDSEIAHVGSLFGVAAFFNGAMRDFCIYPKANIDPKTAHLSPDIATATHFFKMDEGAGATLADSIAGGLTLTTSTAIWDEGYNGGQTFLQDDGSGSTTPGLTFKDSIMFVSDDECIDSGKPTDFDFGTGDFTVIAVVKELEVNTDVSYLSFIDNCNRAAGTPGIGFCLLWATDETLRFGLSNGTTLLEASRSVATLTPSGVRVLIGEREGDNIRVYYDDDATPGTESGASAYDIDPAYDSHIWTYYSDDTYNRPTNDQGNLCAFYVVDGVLTAGQKTTIVTALKAKFT